MNLRPYQTLAVESVYEAWQTEPSTLVVMPTGTGKTIVMAHVIDRLPPGRVMVVAHREELIWQGAQKIKAVTGEKPDIEMAEYRADRNLYDSRVVVASVQTLNSGAGDGRCARFDPFAFGLLLIDEAHHAVADSYQRVLNHFRKNPDLKVLGVTATPDRTDEAALGQVFGSVAYDYEISDAIADGWLAPIRQTIVEVDGLDLSSVRTTAGDLNGADLARVMEFEQTLHEVASPALSLTRDRKALVFAASVAHAERLCEIFNRHRSECARWVCGTTPKEERRQMFADYAAGKFQFLCNVGVATEGFDDPGIQCVVMARPTKSRSLYTQMVGRATRTLPGVVDQFTLAEERRDAIASSGKAFCEVIDFVGNCGKHKLVTAADILGGNYPDEVIELAARKAREAGTATDVLDALQESQAEIHAEHEREKQAEAARRAALRVHARYATRTSDPFDVLGVEPMRERGWDAGRQPTEKMTALLERQGIDTEGMNFTDAKRLIAALSERWDKNLASFKQSKLLGKYGLPTNVTRDQAKEWIDQIAASGWKLPATLQAELEPIERF